MSSRQSDYLVGCDVNEPQALLPSHYFASSRIRSSVARRFASIYPARIRALSSEFPVGGVQFAQCLVEPVAIEPPRGESEVNLGGRREARIAAPSRHTGPAPSATEAVCSHCRARHSAVGACADAWVANAR